MKKRSKRDRKRKASIEGYELLLKIHDEPSYRWRTLSMKIPDDLRRYTFVIISVTPFC